MPLIDTANGPLFIADHRRKDDQRLVVVLIHGAGGSHLDWPAALRRMKGVGVIALDLNGHGRSPGEGRSTVAEYAADVRALLDALHLPPCVLVGHSMGGAIAQTLAVQAPERVRGLALLATGARLGVHPDILNGFSSEVSRVVNLLVGLYFSEAATDSLRRQSTQSLMAFNPRILANDYAACNVFDLRTQLGSIRAPTLVVGAAEDRLTPFKFSEYLHEHIADSQLVRVEGAGHMVMIEQPEAVAAALRPWLAHLPPVTERWLSWAQRLQALAQIGLTYVKDGYDRERYQELSRLAAEMAAAGSDTPITVIRGLFDAQSGYATPKVDVRGVVIHQERLLLVREKIDGGRWTLPGGWADAGETPSLAVTREVQEEAGYRVRAGKLLAVYDRSKHEHPPMFFYVYKLFFRCDLLDEAQALAANIETDETGCFTEDELPGLELSVGRVTLRQLRRFFEHHRHPDWPTEFD